MCVRVEQGREVSCAKCHRRRHFEHRIMRADFLFYSSFDYFSFNLSLLSSSMRSDVDYMVTQENSFCVVSIQRGLKTWTWFRWCTTTLHVYERRAKCAATNESHALLLEQQKPERDEEKIYSADTVRRICGSALVHLTENLLILFLLFRFKFSASKSKFRRQINPFH